MELEGFVDDDEISLVKSDDKDKWYIEANGHVVGEYRGENAREFTHRDFDDEW